MLEPNSKYAFIALVTSFLLPFLVTLAVLPIFSRPSTMTSKLLKNLKALSSASSCLTV